MYIFVQLIRFREGSILPICPIRKGCGEPSGPDPPKFHLPKLPLNSESSLGLKRAFKIAKMEGWNLQLDAVPIVSASMVLGPLFK